MPFDAAGFPTESKPRFRLGAFIRDFFGFGKPADRPDLRQPSAAGLAYVLRHKELWPWDFEWDYQYSHCCAIGLANRFWPRFPRPFTVECGQLRNTLGLDEKDARVIFIGLHGKLGLDAICITPRMVADAIDTMLLKERSYAV